jgi:AcrR family transcriptional regulator
MDKKAEILRCGRELFAANGFKDTNVSDITKKAGIAAGTFYLYYPSKDELFMEIYNVENVNLKHEIMSKLDLDGNPMAVIGEMMRLNYEGMTANPILREWYNREVFSRIEKKFREQNSLENVDFMYSSFTEVVKKWQADGKMRPDIDSSMIMAIFAAVVSVDLHKDEIGFQYFPALMGYLTDFVMNGLLTRPSAND